MGEDRPSGLQQYADNTTIHGIKDFVSTRSKILKVIWGMFLLAAGGLLCEQVYRTAKNYRTEPTSLEVTFVDMDSLPAIHVCVENWFDDTKLRSLGFEDQDIAYLCWYFNSWDENCTTLLWYKDPDVKEGIGVEAERAVREKMMKHNLTTVGDMLYLTSPHIFPIFTEQTMESTLWLDLHYIGALCYSATNVSFEDELYLIGMSKALPGALVVGENAFNMQKFQFDEDPAIYNVDIWDINKLTLLNKRLNYCSHYYNSRQICLDDCQAVWATCTCNLTSTIAFPYMNEDFWSLNPPDFWLNDCNETTDNATRNSCDQRLVTCEEKCKPCTIWSYQYTSSKFLPGEEWPIQIYIAAAEKIIKVSTEYYTYATSSLIGNIGGLMGLFCGASLLSFVQAVVFWFEDGYRSMKVKPLHGQKGGDNQV